MQRFSRGKSGIVAAEELSHEQICSKYCEDEVKTDPSLVTSALLLVSFSDCLPEHQHSRIQNGRKSFSQGFHDGFHSFILRYHPKWTKHAE